jgi:hypothetical protein
MSFYAALMGFLLGMSFGSSDTRTKLQRKLGAFLEARGIRLVGNDGIEIPQAELVAELKKR